MIAVIILIGAILWKKKKQRKVGDKDESYGSVTSDEGKRL